MTYYSMATDFDFDEPTDYGVPISTVMLFAVASFSRLAFGAYGCVCRFQLGAVGVSKDAPGPRWR